MHEEQIGHGHLNKHLCERSDKVCCNVCQHQIRDSFLPGEPYRKAGLCESAKDVDRSSTKLDCEWDEKRSSDSKGSTADCPAISEYRPTEAQLLIHGSPGDAIDIDPDLSVLER